MTSHEDHWKEFKRRRLIAWIFLVTMLPVILLFGWLFNVLLEMEDVELYVAYAWLAAWGIAVMRVTLFPCPRCKKWFFAKWWVSNVFARKCIHCGLPKFSETDPSSATNPGSGLPA